jgi:hypothetical protein
MKRANLARVPPVQDDDALDLWATRITSALQKTVAGIFETGEQLLAARASLKGKWQSLFTERRVPLSKRSADMFIQIYKRREALLTDGKHVSHLPASWGTLYSLACLPDDTLEWAHAHGRITPDLERKQIKQLCAEYAGAPIIDVTPVPAAAPWTGEQEFHRVVEALRPVHALIDIWPDDRSYHPLIHQLRELLKFIERVEAREHGPEISA